jgi:hypothetical protein
MGLLSSNLGYRWCAPIQGKSSLPSLVMLRMVLANERSSDLAFAFNG